MSGTVADIEFPVWGLLPKKETGVTAFRTKYPEYDGRGITIAIFDSGIDPGAPGLQKTSDGKVKITDRFDCSGCGDVTTTTIVQSKEGYITGITGRKLKIPAGWQNPTNSYRLGVKHAYDLYPDRLRERVQQEYREKRWDGAHRTAIAAVNRKLAALDTKQPAAATGTGNASNPLTTSEEEKLTRDDLDAQLEYLLAAEKKFNDAGPVYDCVLFRDAEGKWRVCIDTSERGELETAVYLGEYSVSQDYAVLTNVDQLNVSVNVHDDGNLLEIVGLCSSHGTHVAAITAAYFEDVPEKNGVAPGAQIISLTIGDGRLTSMETGTALIRAMIKVMELSKMRPVHVINMSYGEHAHWSNTGRIGDIMNEVVNKYGVVWIASAGNHGPALSTISSPPDISQDTLIGVGAYVSPEMMEAEYSMRQKVPGTPYTWSSRGPTLSGAVGISVCAPGGAITSVPNFTLRNAELLNGTSMAAPHVAGAVAVLLSGLAREKIPSTIGSLPIADEDKQVGIPYSPFSVRRALENGATFLMNGDPFAQGCGLLNVQRSFELMCEYGNAIERDVRFHIQVSPGNSRGIYIRGKSTGIHDLSVVVEPHFVDNDSVSQRAKINFNLHLNLVCDAPYVNAPRHLHLSNLTRVLGIRLDTTALAYGVYNTSILAYDADCVGKGPVFRIPVTVIVPEFTSVPHHITSTALPFQSNTIRRQYYVVPEHATYAVLRLRSSPNNNSTTGQDRQQYKAMFVLHTMQALPRQRCKALELHRMFSMTSAQEVTNAWQTRGGLVMEVTLAKYWANVGSVLVDYTLSFHGARPSMAGINMMACEGVFAMDVVNLQGDELAPVAQLKNAVQILKPSDSKVLPLLVRDVVPPGRQIYELLLTYSFHLNKTTEISPNSPLFSDFLYESEFESQLWMLYDSNKQFFGSGDAYPSKYCVKLDKGDYTIRMQVRHDKKEYLDKLTDIPLLLGQKLTSAINVDIYGSHTHALTASKKTIVVAPVFSTVTPLYIAPLAADKLTVKNGNVCHYYTGTITYVKDEIGKKVDTYPFKYILGDSSATSTGNATSGSGSGSNSAKSKATSAAKSSTSVTATTASTTTNAVTSQATAGGASGDRDKEPRTKLEEFTDAVRDVKVQWLAKLDALAQPDRIYVELTTDFPDHGPIHTAYLQCLDSMEARRQLPQVSVDCVGVGGSASAVEELARKVNGICDQVIGDIHQETLLAYYAIKNDVRTDSTQIKLGMDRQKTVLIDCLCRKGIALCRLYLLAQRDTTAAPPLSPAEETTLTATDPPTVATTSLVDIGAIWTNILRFVDPNSDRVVSAAVLYLAVWHARVFRHYGRMLKYLQRLAEDGSSGPPKSTSGAATAAAARDIDEKCVDLCKVLEWRHLVDHLQLRILPSKYPIAYRPF